MADKQLWGSPQDVLPSSIMTDWQLPIVAENKPFFAIGLDMQGAAVSEIFNPTLLTWNEEPSTKTSVRYVLSRQTGTGYNERFIYLALCR